MFLTYKKLTVSLLAIALLQGACPSALYAVDVWVTTGDKSKLLAQQPDIVFKPGFGSGGSQVIINSGIQFQTMEGFGAAMTDSSASLIQNSLTTTERDRLMGHLFSSDDGISMSYLRIPMGASDFTSSGFYTYNDLGANQTDITQSQFSIDHDLQEIIPSLQHAKSLNPDLQLMASPWSAPAWMKTNNSLIGGSLDSQWYGSYATYFKKFIEAYANEGLPIDAVTLQNEPNHSPSNYPGMLMSAAEQIDLIKNHVGPTFGAAGIETEILAYDHNWDNTAYPISVLDNLAARQYIAGTAFHGYAGDVSAQSLVHNAHPDKGIHFTEISGGNFAPNFGDNLMFNAQEILIGSARNWGKSAILWNLALDQNNGPHQGGCDDCRGFVTIDDTTGDVAYNEEFYSIAHASKFVQQGAVRIQSSTFDNLIETVAFMNPDGSETLIAANPTNSSQVFRAIRTGKHFEYSLPARSLATFVWESEGADFDNGSFDQGGYETTGGSLDGWSVFGNDVQNVTVTNSIALDEDNSLSLTGNGQSNSFSGITQGITVVGGQTVELQASLFNPSQGGLSGTNNTVALQVEFYDLFGGQLFSADFISKEEVFLATGTTATDQWLTQSINEIVPNGAVEARLVVVFSQPTGQAGTVFVDDLSFSVSVPLLGDFNDDGIVDAADYTVWRDNLGESENTGVLNGNGDGGVVDASDYQLWRANYGSVLSSLSQTSSSVATIPESSGCQTLAVCLCLVACYRR